MKNSNKLDANTSLDFIFGGNSTFTALNTKSENRFTFKVKKHKKDDIYFVSVLTSPETYQFIGSYRGAFKYSAKSRISDRSQSVSVFKYIIDKLSSKNLPNYIEVWHSGKCGKCGKKLTTPDSISNGFGPTCRRFKN